MTAYLYPISVAVLSVAVALAERLWPWRPQQRALRPADAHGLERDNG